jgi:light-regulated signal transduction histidine kinase (bacteriophytochrome)
MSFSGELFDGMFDLAHSLKKVTYILVLIGLMFSMFQLFRQAEEGSSKLAKVNESLANEITNKLHAEEKLEQKADQLQRSNTELEQFAYVASHDLQEPLRMVTSYVKLIERRYGDKLDDEGKEFISFAAVGAVRMQQLIDGLLDYSRLNTLGKRFRVVDINDTVRKAIKTLEVAIEECGAQIMIADDLPEVYGDDTQLLQLFQNLIGNAIKFTGDRPQQIAVTATERGNLWEFSVSDTGIGIETKHIERIFLIFQRLHSREDYPGTGIGLAVCKRIVGRHGGTISVVSQPGEGSTFVFSLAAPDESR